MEKIKSHHYLMDENNSQKRKAEILYVTDTDHVYTEDNEILTAVIDQINKDIEDASNKAKSMTLELTGDVKGYATVADDYTVSMNTELSKTYAQKVELTGVVTGEAYPSTKEDGVITIDVEYTELPTTKVVLTGDVTGSGEVNNKTGQLDITTTVHNSSKLPLPVNSIEFSTNSEANAILHTVYGGTWDCLGSTNITIDGTTNAFLLYMYKKTSLT